MRIPQLFVSGRGTENKIDLYMNVTHKTCDINTDKELSKLELKLVKGNQKVFVNYFPYIKNNYYSDWYLELLRMKSIRVISRSNEEKDVEDLIVLANKIGFYHKGFQSITVKYCKNKKSKHKECVCDVLLKHSPNSKLVSNAVKYFYPSMFDEVRAQKVAYKRRNNW